jgi:hypothetical protein
MPKILSNVATPLIWRTAEQTPSLVALRELHRRSGPRLPRLYQLDADGILDAHDGSSNGRL